MSADLVVIVPSHGRPDSAVELVEAFAETCTGDVKLLFAVDDDDPTNAEYGRACQILPFGHHVTVNVVHCPSKTMVEALNMAAVNLCIPETWTPHHDGFPPPFAVGFMGDDHRPRTVGWDEAYLTELRAMGTGIVYGDDLYQSENLPTQCAMTSDIIRALGWMAPPFLKHMYVDNFWRDLGRWADCLMYLHNVVVEHMHPAAGKAEDDTNYQRVNSVFQEDGTAYAAYVANEMSQATNKVLVLRGKHHVQAISPDIFVQKLQDHQWRLFTKDTVPEYTKPEWYAGRDHAPHLEQFGPQRDRLMVASSLVAQAAFSHPGDTSLVDLGAGDGGLLSLLGPRIKAWGYDLMPTNLDAAHGRGVDVRYGDVVNGDIEWGTIAVATEMLEHLVDPHAFVRRINQHAKYLVCSSPHTERPGNAYEFHTWAWDLEGYRALVEQGGYRVLRQRMVGPFQVILAVQS